MSNFVKSCSPNISLYLSKSLSSRGLAVHDWKLIVLTMCDLLFCNSSSVKIFPWWQFIYTLCRLKKSIPNIALGMSATIKVCGYSCANVLSLIIVLSLPNTLIGVPFAHLMFICVLLAGWNLLMGNNEIEEPLIC